MSDAISLPPAGGHPSNVACGVAISSCGNVTSIAYPSWLVHDDSTSLHSHCGYRGFELICRNNTPSIHLPSSNYSVTNIDYETRTISLVDVDIVSVREECPRVHHNLTFDPDSILRYAPSDVNITFFFDCIDGPRDLHIPSLSSAVGNRSYVFTTDTMRDSYRHLPRTCCWLILQMTYLPDTEGCCRVDSI
uniref:Wall-associated receptor kinase galacturonan-binding domain-containing protein n=1 Tax=Musa acuminata subsp. malaccensis TaxID=214687 RepID=A0A804II45_MUSAM|nr:PREDICTED: LEAF RUST 10 DISEASE-RESISTANCE LOCUS RECEPTOR-LIKE PROTEIN KINASE-like 1.2 [Musa acuminata subsp. malaccensis]